MRVLVRILRGWRLAVAAAAAFGAVPGGAEGPQTPPPDAGTAAGTVRLDSRLLYEVRGPGEDIPVPEATPAAHTELEGPDEGNPMADLSPLRLEASPWTPDAEPGDTVGTPALHRLRPPRLRGMLCLGVGNHGTRYGSIEIAADVTDSLTLILGAGAGRGWNFWRRGPDPCHGDPLWRP
ncbi:MAG: hypothetical protein JXR77_10445 [Lentisphaeria bacterium]|nr:hypothetical protein [Lentisphaeria bacterium]